MSPTKIIKANDIVAWSEKGESRLLLPVLIRRLIIATCEQSKLKSIQFPGYESTTSTPGYDGIVEYESQNARVPQGKSVWELSTAEKVQSKADDDYQKRTNNPLGIDKSDTTYIGLSTRKWNGKNNWKDEKNSQSQWNDVRFYDANDLELWLETAPIVSMWFAKEVGLPITSPGISLLEHHWEGVRIMVRDGITIRPELFTNSRAEDVSQLVAFLKGPPGDFPIQSDSDSATLDFIAAVIKSMSDKERESIFSRALVLDNEDGLHSILCENSPLVLVAKSTLPIPPERIALIVKKHKHHLVRLSPKFRGNSALILQRFNRYNLQAELERAGLSPVKAGQLAKQTGGSGVNLRNLIAQFTESVEPKERRDNLRPFVWMGGWNRNSLGDLAIVQKMCEKCGSNDKDMESIISVIAIESQNPNSLFYLDSDIVSLYSKHQAWNMFSSSVRTSELDTFLETAVEVLTEQNPVNALPADERMLAGMRGISPQFSNFLKENIAETLACIASLNDTKTINFPGIEKRQLQDKIDGAVSQVLHKGMTTLEWASLGQTLCLLAEASPNTFISVVRDELGRGQNSCFVELMKDDGDAFFGGCHHASLLWALEMLSCSKEFHRDVVELLLDLANIDIGGKWGNRPWESLIEIYCPEYLRSDVTIEERILLLDNLFKRKEASVWDLLWEIALNTPFVATNVHFPQWRDWGLNIKQEIDNDSRRTLTEWCENHLLDYLKDDFARWKKVLERLTAFNVQEPSHRLFQLLETLGNKIPEHWTDSQRAELVNIVRVQLHRDNRVKEENAIFTEDIRGRLRCFMEQVEPSDSVVRYVWLFEQGTYYKFYNNNFEESKLRLRAEQQRAVSSIIEQSDMQGLMQLILDVKTPGVIGNIVAERYGDRFINELLPDYLDSSNDNEKTFVHFYIARLCPEGRTDWDRVVDNNQSKKLDISQWDISAVVSFFAAFPFVQNFWDWLQEFDEEIRNEYWKSRNDCFFLKEKLTPELSEKILICLKTVHNFAAALIFASHTDCLDEFNHSVLLDLLERCIAHFDDKIAAQSNDILLLIESVQERFKQGILTEQDSFRLAKIELCFIRLLIYDRQVPTLESFLASSPDFFVDVLKKTYLPNKEELEHLNDVEEEEEPDGFANASNLHSILSHWQRLPGETDEQSKTNARIDNTALESWVEQSRELARTCARLGSCDYQIGQLLARRSLSILKGQLPPDIFLKILQTIGTESILNGFRVGLLNGRGVTVRSPFDGGEQERTLSKNYEKLADECRYSYPKVSQVFNDLAKDYTFRAEREDERAQRTELF